MRTGWPLERKKSLLFHELLQYVDVWGLLGCPHRLTNCTSQLRLKKEPRVSIRDIGDFMDGGFSQIPVSLKRGCHQHPAPKPVSQGRDSPWSQDSKTILLKLAPKSGLTSQWNGEVKWQSEMGLIFLCFHLKLYVRKFLNESGPHSANT